MNKPQRDPKTGKWFVQFRYTDWQGNRRKSTRRGFSSKRDCEAWLSEFLLTKQADLNMRFDEFVKLYFEDMESRLRESTIQTKKYIIDLKILPYFGNKRINEIKPADIRKWQSALLGQGYAQTYLRTIYNQLNAIFNYAVRYYDLKSNPCKAAGSIGEKKAEPMEFWTLDEFNQFLRAIMDKRQSYIGFSTLFWTGSRIGELLSLSVKNFDPDKKTLTINESFQRIKKKDVVTPPKTKKSKRIITLPDFLVLDLSDYIDSMYGLQADDRLFPFTKSFFEHEMQRGIKKSGVKRIRLHDLRHSHASHLVELGFTPLAIAERLGHERVQTTMETYAHLYPNKQAELAEQLNFAYRKELENAGTE